MNDNDLQNNTNTDDQQQVEQNIQLTDLELQDEVKGGPAVPNPTGSVTFHRYTSL